MSVCDSSEEAAKSIEAGNVLTRCRSIDRSTIAVVSNLSEAAVHDFNFLNYSALYNIVPHVSSVGAMHACLFVIRLAFYI